MVFCVQMPVTMIKTAYQQELKFTGTCQKGSKGKTVKQVQEWLNLSVPRFPDAALATTVDSEFGSATEKAVKNFQKAAGLPQTGIVTAAVFNELSGPLKKAFTIPAKQTDIRKQVLQIAQNHLKLKAIELQADDAQNLGPWVRSYCDGFDGSPFKWCMGFVQSVLDIAATAHGKSFTSLMPQTLSCDVVAMAGKQNGRLIDNAAVRKDPGKVKAGDVFLIRMATVSDWFHTGIITGIDGDVFETLEGNTDVKGSSNGTGVFARVRNFRKGVIDVFSIDGLGA